LQQNMAARLDEDDFDIEEFEVIKISSLISWSNGHLQGKRMTGVTVIRK
jgi:hypothetical protein